MGKKWIKVLLVLVFLGILLLRADKNVVFDSRSNVSVVGNEIEETEQEMVSTAKDIEEIATENNGDIPCSEYSSMNAHLLDRDFIEEVGDELIKKGMYLYSEEVKGEFAPVVPKDCSFPEELVVMMEDIFYHSSNPWLRNLEESYYDEKLREMGSQEFKIDLEEVYELFPKLSEYKDQIKDISGACRWINVLYTDLWEFELDGCINMYHFNLTEETDNYIFVTYFSSSTVRYGHVYVMERAGEKLVKLHEFGTEAYGGELIHYGGEFYFVTWEENDALSMVEGIRVHRLNGNPKEETLCIRYLPEKYVWSTLYNVYSIISSDESDASFNRKRKSSEEIDKYVEKLEKEFVPGRYLRGEEEDKVRTEIYYGDEGEAESLDIDDHGSSAYKVDIANCGLPIYVSKYMVWPDSYSEYMRVNFFYPVPEENNLKELEHLSCTAQQLWFKEIEGKMHTCQIFRICEFNYLFNIVLLQKNGERVERTVVYSASIAPRRKFVVTEGPVSVLRAAG